jgi:hypothetical protein
VSDIDPDGVFAGEGLPFHGPEYDSRASVSVWISGSYASRSGTLKKFGPLPNCSRPPSQPNPGEVREPGQRGRPRLCHEYLDLVRGKLKRYRRRSTPVTYYRDRLRNFHREVWFLLLAGYNPCSIQGLFAEELPNLFPRLSYDGVITSVRSAVLRASEGDLLLEDNYAGLLEYHRSGPWAPNAPDWLRAQYGVPLIGEGKVVDGKDSSKKNSGIKGKVSGQGPEKVSGAVVGTDPVVSGVKDVAGLLQPGPDGYTALELLFLEGLFKQVAASGGLGLSLPAATGGVGAGGSVSSGGVIPPSGGDGRLREKTRVEKMAELDEEIAVVEGKFGVLNLTREEYLGALRSDLDGVLGARAVSDGSAPGDSLELKRAAPEEVPPDNLEVPALAPDADAAAVSDVTALVSGDPGSDPAQPGPAPGDPDPSTKGGSVDNLSVDEDKVPGSSGAGGGNTPAPVQEVVPDGGGKPEDKEDDKYEEDDKYDPEEPLKPEELLKPEEPLKPEELLKPEKPEKLLKPEEPLDYSAPWEPEDEKAMWKQVLASQPRFVPDLYLVEAKIRAKDERVAEREAEAKTQVQADVPTEPSESSVLAPSVLAPPVLAPPVLAPPVQPLVPALVTVQAPAPAQVPVPATAPVQVQASAPDVPPAVGETYVELREWRSECLTRNPASLVLTGIPNYFPNLWEGFEKNARGAQVSAAMFALWRRWCDGEVGTVPDGFTLFKYDREVFEGCARHGYTSCNVMEGIYGANIWVLRLMTEAMVTHAFGLQAGTKDGESRRFLQYAEPWTVAKAREMLNVGSRTWCYPMNPAMVEARKPLRFEDMPPGYAWVPGWGLMPREEVQRLWKLAVSGFYKGDYYLSPEEEPELRKAELLYAQAVDAALGAREVGPGSMKSEQAKFLFRNPERNSSVFPEPFGADFMLLRGGGEFSEVFDLSRVRRFWGREVVEEALAARLQSVSTYIHRNSSGMVSEVLGAVRHRFLSGHRIRNAEGGEGDYSGDPDAWF